VAGDKQQEFLNSFREFLKAGKDKPLKELVEKLGRRDQCPCGSGRRFQELLPAFRGV
jgi:uncharacterized protein YecA (UPF0149 family)